MKGRTASLHQWWFAYYVLGRSTVEGDKADRQPPVLLGDLEAEVDGVWGRERKGEGEN